MSKQLTPEELGLAINSGPSRRVNLILIGFGVVSIGAAVAVILWALNRNKCENNADCDSGVCSDRECVQCAKNGDCQSGFECKENKCVPIPTPKPDCTQDSDCSGEQPKCVNGKCNCTDASCKSKGDQFVCDQSSGACVDTTPPNPCDSCSFYQNCKEGECKFNLWWVGGPGIAAGVILLIALAVVVTKRSKSQKVQKKKQTQVLAVTDDPPSEDESSDPSSDQLSDQLLIQRRELVKKMVINDTRQNEKSFQNLVDSAFNDTEKDIIAFGDPRAVAKIPNKPDENVYLPKSRDVTESLRANEFQEFKRDAIGTSNASMEVYKAQEIVKQNFIIWAVVSLIFLALIVNLVPNKWIILGIITAYIFVSFYWATRQRYRINKAKEEFERRSKVEEKKDPKRIDKRRRLSSKSDASSKRGSRGSRGSSTSISI